jgi:predicted DNA-binding transcriptional regulator
VRVVKQMTKDQAYGLVIFLVSVVVTIVYLAMFFARSIGLPAYLRAWAIGIPVLLFVLLVLAISGWIGWTMLTTPPPAPLEAETTPAAETSKETPKK